jgi:hypothetical protein
MSDLRELTDAELDIGLQCAAAAGGGNFRYET